jgi:hypothetical protein
MNAMKLPGFSGEASLYESGSHYRHGRAAQPAAQSVVPAIPYCGNCDYILDNCSRNGWRPRGLCNLCAAGACYDSPEPGQTS